MIACPTVAAPEAAPRRPIFESYLAPLPSKLTTKTRLGTSAKDAEVLLAVSAELGRLYRGALAARLRAGNDFDAKADFATLQRNLTLSVPSRYAGSIALAVRAEYALAKRNAYDQLYRLRRQLKQAHEREQVLRLRRAGEPVPEGLKKVKAGLTLDGVRRQLELLESNIRQVEGEIASGHFSVCKGSAKLLKARLNLGESRFANADEWRQEWAAERLWLACKGSKRAKWGNQLIAVDPMSGLVEVALPKDPHFQQYDNTGRGRYRLDTRVDFKYKGDEWRAALAGGQAVYYEFAFDPRVGRQGKSGQPRWYLATTIDALAPAKPLAETLAEARSGGVVAIDLNHELLCCRYIDAAGNPASGVYDIVLDWEDTHAKERATVLGQELAKLCKWAASKGARVIAIEDLDFRDVKEKKRNKTTNRKLHGIPTAAFRHLLVAIAARHGLRIIACDPAYTSKDAGYWADVGPRSQDFKLSRHQAAAVNIGRRSLALALRRQSTRPTRGSKQGFYPGAGSNGSKMSATSQHKGEPKRTKPPPQGRFGDTTKARLTRRTTDQGGAPRGRRRRPQPELREPDTQFEVSHQDKIAGYTKGMGRGKRQVGHGTPMASTGVEDFILLGDALRQEDVRQQTQYASRHLTGAGESTLLGEGLRFDLSGYEHGGDYHSICIHKDDSAEFARRLREHYAALGVKV